MKPTKSFKQYLDSKPIVISTGRLNPPHIGNYELLKFMSKFAKSKNADAVLYLNDVQNNRKNPLSYNEKLVYIKEILPSGIQIANEPFKNIFEITEKLIQTGYTDIYLVTGEDRINDFEVLKKQIKKINPLATLKIVNSGKRTPGVSGNAIRNYIKENDFENFKKLLPPKLYKYSKEIFNKIRMYLKGKDEI
jgi:nicotinic acid mononucleotide adenylyltransferase